MLESMLGRFISGALWGLAAGVVATVATGGGPGARAVARRVLSLGIAATERARAVGEGAREGLEDLYAEARPETPPAEPEPDRGSEAPQRTPRPRPKRPRRA